MTRALLQQRRVVRYLYERMEKQGCFKVAVSLGGGIQVRHYTFKGHRKAMYQYGKHHGPSVKQPYYHSSKCFLYNLIIVIALSISSTIPARPRFHPNSSKHFSTGSHTPSSPPSTPLRLFSHAPHEPQVYYRGRRGIVCDLPGDSAPRGKQLAQGILNSKHRFLLESKSNGI